MLLFHDCRLAIATTSERVVASDRAAGERAAARAMKELLGHSAAERAIVRDADGVPHCEPAGITLSIAHRDGRGAALAAMGDIRLGVDLERDDAVAPRHARYFLSRAERTSWSSTDLTALWALKEAAWKALRCNDSTPFHALTLEPDARPGACTLRVGPQRIPARFALVRPARGWIVAAVRATAEAAA